jgi:hypothetical protein
MNGVVGARSQETGRITFVSSAKGPRSVINLPPPIDRIGYPEIAPVARTFPRGPVHPKVAFPVSFIHESLRLR